MPYPDLDNARIQAANTIVQAKTMINRLKNHISPESTEYTQLSNYCDSLPDGAWKTQVGEALTSLSNINTAIVNEGL